MTESSKLIQYDDGYLNKTPIFQFVLLSRLFALWGAAASLNDILITQFKSVFTLSDFAHRPQSSESDGNPVRRPPCGTAFW